MRIALEIDMNPTIKSEWESFREMTIDPEAPDIQIEEMRNAYYAGVKALSMMQLALSDANLPEEVEFQIFSSWHKEVDSYFAVLTKDVLRDNQITIN